MKCPNCQQNAPATNYKCPHCGQVLKTGMDPRQFSPSPGKRKSLNINHFLMVAAVMGVVIIATLMIQQGTGRTTGQVEESNGSVAAFRPGEQADIEKLAHYGKITIFDFYSEYCPPCRMISPRLEKLDRKREDIVVVKMNINRKNVQGIDWNSPLARQYDLRSIPYFIIYGPDGKLTHEGNSATQRVAQLLTAEGM
jgi:thiol-disulfide isomerase/thioredoxin